MRITKTSTFHQQPTSLRFPVAESRVLWSSYREKASAGASLSKLNHKLEPDWTP